MYGFVHWCSRLHNKLAYSHSPNDDADALQLFTLPSTQLLFLQCAMTIERTHRRRVRERERDRQQTLNSTAVNKFISTAKLSELHARTRNIEKLVGTYYSYSRYEQDETNRRALK